MQTHFSSQTLAELFRDLYLAEQSGVLHLARGGAEKKLSFDRGLIVFAESDLEDEDLGRRLVREGKLSPGALAEGRQNVSESRDLPQVLVNRGLIAREALSPTVRHVVERVVETVFAWEGGTACFREGPPLQEILEGDIVTTFEVLLRGVFHMADFTPIREAMKGLDRPLVMREQPSVPVERLALSPSHGFILSRVDGTASVKDVLSILPPAEEDLACRFLYGLLVMGVLRTEPPVGDGPFEVTAILREHAESSALATVQEQMIVDQCQALDGKAAHEVLGIAADATHEEIERAYEAAKQRLTRDGVLPRVRERRRAEIALLGSRLVEAYLTLTQARPQDAPGRPADGQDPHAEATLDDLLVRVEMDKTKTKMAIEENSKLADVYYGKARKFMRDGDFFNAIQYGKLAISYNAEDARYYSLLADCQVRNPEARWQRLAEQNYIKATQLDQWNAEYRVSLGRFYKRRGLKLRARRQFEQALELVPSHPAALEEIKGL